MDSTPRDQLIVALDTGDLSAALDMVRRLGDEVAWYKVGLQLFSAAGPSAVRTLRREGKRVFLDLKLHDIPNTVTQAALQGADLGADLIDLHVAAGAEAMRAAAEALQARYRDRERPRLLGVTVLTSLRRLADQGELSPAGLVEAVVARALEAQAAGLDGVVAPAPAAAEVRRRCGAAFRLLTPGIRPSGAERADQQWIATPQSARAAGADWIVVGRPITAAPDPVAAAREILGALAAPPADI
ncbi:MAG: orotidine-5'-phosphate decarboxylase [Candidatus Eisenbacteria sp.]|nr:orotidine-5'-phosphate decarboxylase [Candidatus Eisenbacteria bacterium]